MFSCRSTWYVALKKTLVCTIARSNRTYTRMHVNTYVSDVGPQCALECAALFVGHGTPHFCTVQLHVDTHFPLALGSSAYT